MSMPRRVAALVRHGKYHQPQRTPSAHLPYPLTPEGEIQAHQCAEEILLWADKNGFEIWLSMDASSLRRAWQTATIMARTFTAAQERSFEVAEYPALAERGVGAAANLTTDAIEDLLRDDPRFTPPPENWKSRSDYKLPFLGAESLLEAGARVAAHMDQRMDALPRLDQRPLLMVFVGHGGSLRHAAVQWGVLTRENVVQVSMYHARPVYLERDAFGNWTHLAGDWKPRPATTNDV